MLSSLKFKISISLFVLVISILSLVLWQGLEISFQQNKKDSENLKNITLTLLEQTARTALFSEEYDTIQFRIDSIIDQPHIVNISISDNRNIVVASNQFEQLGRPLNIQNENNRTVWKTIVISNITGTLGVLYIEYSNLEFQEANKNIIVNVLIMAIFGTLIVAGISLFAGHILTRRLNIVTKAAHEISKGNFKIRTNLRGKDEISRLGLTFDEMATHVDENQRKMKKLNLHLEQRVEARTEDYRKAIKELEAFSYSVSHDLRAPLRSIDGFSQALLEDYYDTFDDKAKEYLDRVRKNTLHMSNLIEGLLNLSRINQYTVNLTKVDLSKVCLDIFQRLQELDSDRNVKIFVESNIVVYADQQLITVALENLLSNSWKYSENLIYPAIIEFGFLKQDEQLVYFVKDNGAGFDMKNSDKLFAVFQRLHSNSEFKGTGVGLSTVQRIVHRHGGYIWAESSVGKGACFYFTLCESPNTPA